MKKTFKYAISLVTLFSLGGCIATSEGTSTITPKNVNDIISKNKEQYDLNLAKEKGLCKVEKQELNCTEYESLQKKYRQIYEKWLVQELKLDVLNTNIQQSSEKYTPTKTYNKQTFEHQQSTMAFDYIHMKNLLRIEQLTQSEIEELRQTSDVSFVQKTFKKLIKINQKEASDVNVGLQPEFPEFTPNESILIVISYSNDFDGNGNYIDKEASVRKYNEMKNKVEQLNAKKDKVSETPVLYVLQVL